MLHILGGHPFLFLNEGDISKDMQIVLFIPQSLLSLLGSTLLCGIILHPEAGIVSPHTPATTACRTKTYSSNTHITANNTPREAEHK
jgi:hypothetical protein